LPANASLVNQLQIYLVNKSRSLQRMILSFSAQKPMRLPMKFVINKRKKIVQRCAVPTAPGL